VSSPHLRRATFLLCALSAGLPAHAGAQQSRPSIIAVDNAASADIAVDNNGNHATRLFVDSEISAGIGGGFEAILWPIAQKLTNGDWQRDIWIAELRYEHPGPVAVRVDAGVIPSPIGLSSVFRRPHMNPTIAQPSSTFAALPPLQFRGPRTTLLGPLYPMGGQVTVSGAHWDARAAVMDTSPLRARGVLPVDVRGVTGNAPDAPRFTNVVIGGGITPFVGFRVGTSFAHGGFMRAGESPTVTADHNAAVATVESELSFRFTKLLGEYVRDSVETDADTQMPSGWYVQGQQTLAPRWFAAGRLERLSSPVALPTLAPFIPVDQHLTSVEEVLGYRVTPDLTLRVGHRARRTFGRPGFDNQFEASVVWWKRWL
jgi:hypothetical protein